MDREIDRWIWSIADAVLGRCGEERAELSVYRLAGPPLMHGLT